MTNTKQTKILNAVFKYLNTDWGVKVSNSGRIWIDLRKAPRGTKTWRYSAKTPDFMLIDTKQYNILKRVWQSGYEGLKYTDIQMFIIGGEEQIKAGPSSLPHTNKQWDWNSKKFISGNRLRPSRGKYGAWLTNQLPLYAIKKPNGKWILDHPILKRHFESRFPKP